MPFKTQSVIEKRQQDYLQGNFSLPAQANVPASVHNILNQNVPVIKAPTAAFFYVHEVKNLLDKLPEDTEYVKVFLVKDDKPRLTMAMAGAKEKNNKPTPTEFVSGEDPKQMVGLMAFKPCPPHCQNEKEEVAQSIFIIKA